MQRSKEVAKKVMTYLYLPGRALIAGNVELRDVKGALAGVLRQLAAAGINLKHCSASDLVLGERAVLSLVGEMPLDLDIKKLKETICDSSDVFSCDFHRSDDGFIVNTLQYPFSTSDGEQVALFPRKAMGSMIAKVEQALGTGGEFLIFEEGRALGKEWQRRFLESVPRGFVATHEEEMLALYAALGWGVMEVADAAPKGTDVLLVIRDCFECASVEAKQPTCHFVRGILAAANSELVGTEVSVTEVECRAVGASACKFALKWKK